MTDDNSMDEKKKLKNKLEVARRDRAEALERAKIADEKALSTIAKLKATRDILQATERNAAQFEAEAVELERKLNVIMRSQATIPGSSDESQNKKLEQILSLEDPPEVQEIIKAYHNSMDKKSYDHVWRERRDLIMSYLERGEDRLSRALARIRRAEERNRAMGLDLRRWIVDDEALDLPWRPAAAAYRSAVVEAVMDAVTPQTSKIIETGSGWGEHLCNIYLEGGPAGATYYALELEKEGRICSLLLASLDPLFNLRAGFFDYRQPDYSMVEKDDGHTILLTAHSIEQVKDIHQDCLRVALTLSSRVTGVHFEPVGWQTHDRNDWRPWTQQHYERCQEKSYNTNLVSLLRAMEAEELIRIRIMKPNFIGLDYNPATLIVWEKVVSAPSG